MYEKQFKNMWALIPLTMFAAVTILPVNALLFESNIVDNTDRFVATVELAGRDPYLAEAINGLPNYEYTDSGSLTSVPAPVTEKGVWPTLVQFVRPRIAYAAQVEPQEVKNANGLVLEGEASFYSRAGCLGCDKNVIMANGQPLDDNALTMAIGANKKHLVGHSARVTSLTTGKSVMVRITDTGGFYAAKYGYRVADLTIATKSAIGMNGGKGPVRVEVF